MPEHQKSHYPKTIAKYSHRNTKLFYQAKATCRIAKR